NEIVEYIAIRDNINVLTDDKSHLFKQIERNDFSILIQLQIDEFDMLDKFYNNITVDQVEKNFSYNLLSYLPKEYSFENVYSLGEGKFALLTDFATFENTKLDINVYLNQFVNNVKESSLKFDDMEFDLNITVSYAIGKYMLYEDSRAGLIKALDKKLKVCFANDSSIIVSKEAKQNLEMIRTVKIALENYNIISYFQPIINNKTQEIEKYESLVRLIDEDNNVISPIEFLNISKKGNYYNKITERVLENSFKILHSVNTKVSINLSASDIEKEQTRTKIFSLLDEYIEDNDRIIFELLEDENIQDMKTIVKFIRTIKHRGVKIAIDDFGSGYSNFERVFAFEPDILKIDGSLVKNIVTDTFSRNLVETIVIFAKKQNIETIAEYVENESIFNILNELGVNYSQGYYFGKPAVFETNII
ncbi:MAG: EAL domain-containing protein, partial [Arcobacteraceae bacterium]